MATKSLFNRRFVRLQAVQQLYAFFVCKQANYEGALAHIKAAFVPDIFADLPIAPEQLIQEAAQARDLFDTSLATLSPPIHTNDRVNTAVIAALKRYKQELGQDTRKLERGLTDAVGTMNQVCVLIWQLLVEWTHLAKKQAEKPKLSASAIGTSTVYLSDSHLLQRLQDESNLAELVQKERAGWDAYMPLVEGWYHQFVKKDPTVQAYLTDLNPAQEQRLLLFLVEEIIFGKEAIQEFFGTLDLDWAVHQRIVKKRVRQGILVEDSEKEFKLKTFGPVADWEEEQQFYTDLIHRTLEHGKELEGHIVQKSENWTIERINVLDKAIIKLALCEMMYFPTIPTKVSINEYIEIAKIYSIPKSKLFVNGVLDAIAGTLYPEEMARKV